LNYSLYRNNNIFRNNNLCSGVTLDAVSYVQRALLPDLSSTEAAATFARFIEESLSSWFTQVRRPETNVK
jgi:hypothetical protein